MRIAILSRNKNLHSIRRLTQEARKKGVACDVINPLECQLILRQGKSQIFVGNEAVPEYDAVLPRIGASITEYGLAVVKQFEAMGMYTVNTARSIADSRDKMRSLQILTSAGLSVPATVLSRSHKGLRTTIQAVNGLPTVLKVLQGTQGVGVMLVHTPISLTSVVDAFQGMGQDVIIQQFIAEGAGQDYRAFVIGNRLVAAMRRTAPKGEFRSNIHRGGAGNLIELPKDFEQTALRAAKVLGLEVAGVDLMESNHGPLILEVNSSPGFEGIERATGLNVASAIISRIKKRAKAPR